MRAPRFPLQLAMRYRPLGGEWRHATTGNVSASGVFVQVANAPKINTQIEFKLTLSAGDTTAPGEVYGRGRVVRVVPTVDAPKAGFAVAIEEYDFLSTDPRRLSAGKTALNTRAT